MDVDTLYTNIPHEEGMDAFRVVLEEGREGRDLGTKPYPYLMCTLICLILTLIFFTFHDKTYLETHGPAMGNKSKFMIEDRVKELNHKLQEKPENLHSYNSTTASMTLSTGPGTCCCL
ncbi:hypothetical protein RRG08_010604 [Elysia crispata]|uniref:Reverse transcriptase domain-containing protein n=1 Tax=Elysia crispata TaxID=231223 RepID=A0AAE1DS17_9GAST|nr:hypothetical protein RRG08_010604 [Elysia crispata]